MTLVKGRVKLGVGVGAVGALLLLLAVTSVWPGSDDAAIGRYFDEGERPREVVYQADYTTGEGREVLVGWGTRGAIRSEEDPRAPFERVGEAQLGDRVIIRVLASRFDPKLRCSLTVKGKLYVGKLHGSSCEASAIA